ncbi:MAG: hypothetical protein JSW53_01740 [Candidatus Bathyarchaeota archaeon]|nr:MAG: hypothetical protein JSW53_01740 [Candidatus Bathyarchaeota archaeon]
MMIGVVIFAVIVAGIIALQVYRRYTTAKTISLGDVSKIFSVSMTIIVLSWLLLISSTSVSVGNAVVLIDPVSRNITEPILGQ